LGLDITVDHGAAWQFPHFAGPEPDWNFVDAGSILEIPYPRRSKIEASMEIVVHKRLYACEAAFPADAVDYDAVIPLKNRFLDRRIA
jgi:hypothetical protein